MGSKVLSDLMSPISALLTDSNLLASDISKVILAGGSTKVTKIQSALSSMFPQAEMMSSLAPDEVIAIGAAVQASYITKETTKHVNTRPNVIDFSNKFFFCFSIYYFCFVQLLFVMFVPIIELFFCLFPQLVHFDLFGGILFF